MQLLFSAVIAITLFHLSAQQICSESELKHFDSTVAKLLTIGNSGRKFPEDRGQQLENYCNQSTVYLQQIDNYKRKCLKDLPKQVTGVIVYSLKNSVDQLCRRETKRLDDLLAATPCANRATAQFNICYAKYIDVLLGAQNSKHDEKKIPYNCCGYHKLIDCIYTRGRRVSNCSDVQLERIQDFVRSVFSDVINLICGDYTSDSDKCKNLGPPPKKRKDQRRTKSFIIPYIDLLSSFSKF